MKFDVNSEMGRAMKALDRASGHRLTNALRAGYAGAARVIRDRAKVTTAWSDKSGHTRKAWRISQNRKPYNHAKVVNTSAYALFLERAPLESGFMERAARATDKEQLGAVRKAVLRHLLRLRAAQK